MTHRVNWKKTHVLAFCFLKHLFRQPRCYQFGEEHKASRAGVNARCIYNNICQIPNFSIPVHIGYDDLVTKNKEAIQNSYFLSSCT